MTAYVVSMIAEARESLVAMLEGGATSVRIGPQEDMDTAGAQLLVAAVLDARAVGRSLAIELPRDGEAGRLWRGLGLDLLPETVWLDGGAG